MSYSAFYVKKSRKFLYFLAAASFVSLFMGTIFFVKQQGIQNGWQKTGGIDKLYVVNRSSHGFEVIWSTVNSVKENQWVEVGKEKGAYPIKSTQENGGDVFHAKITGLQADSTYYFRVRIGTKTYLLPSLISDTVHTPKEAKQLPISPAYGKVVLPSEKPYANGVLIYEIDGYYPLAVATKATGEWLLPLTGLIEKKNNTITYVSDSTSVSLKLFSYPEGITRTVVGQTRPLRRAIVAGVSLNLAQTVQSKTESVLGVSSQNIPSVQEQQSNKPIIIYPKEGALIPGNTPLIRGTASIGADVVVFIQATSAKQYSYRTKANEKGEWLVQYPLVLDPGKYIIVATIENGVSSAITLKRTFSIIKSGEQVLGIATGSPTLMPTAPVPTYANPTSSPNPTAFISPINLTPTHFMPTNTPPVSGGGMSPFLFGALFCIVIGAGLVLAF